jgi:hypothetical protein
MRRGASIPSIPGNRQSNRTRSKGSPTWQARTNADSASSPEDTARATKLTHCRRSRQEHHHNRTGYSALADRAPHRPPLQGLIWVLRGSIHREVCPTRRAEAAEVNQVNFSMAANKSAGRTGLVTYPSIPAAIQRSSSPLNAFAVIATMGRWNPPSCSLARMAAVA